MKIQCNVCEAAEANVLCCADEAALCWTCDEKVHAANKLASKHQRIPLSTSSPQMPKCDICQIYVVAYQDVTNILSEKGKPRQSRRKGKKRAFFWFGNKLSISASYASCSQPALAFSHVEKYIRFIVK